MRCWGRSLCWAALFVTNLAGQNGSVIVGASYLPPARGTLSPGQVVTLLVRGISAPDSQAARVPLPLDLSGVAAVMQEPSMGYRKPMPILRIERIPCGLGLAFVCDYKAVTVQVPVDLPVVPSLGAPGKAPTPTITLSENGVAGFAIEFILQNTTVKILNNCYLIIRSANPTCAALVTHADGNLITAGNPGRSGEVVVLYAMGLGLTSPPVPEGQAAPSPSPRTVTDLFATFSADALPPSAVPDSTWARPVYSGLVSGFVGLYQVNLHLPDIIPLTLPDCGEGSRRLTITLSAVGSADAAQICVKP